MSFPAVLAPTQSPSPAAARRMAVSVRRTLSLAISLARDPIPPCAPCLLTPAPSALLLADTRHNHRSCMAFTVQRDKNTRSKCSTRVTSSATTSSVPPSQRKILSSALALAIQVSCACIGHFRTIGVSVSCCSLLSSRLSKEEAYVDCPPVTPEEGRGHLCWQRVIPQSVSSIDSATTQPPLASPRVVTFLCPRPCYGRRSDCHDFLPAKISTPPSNDGSALRLSRHVREPPHISFFGHTYSLPDDRLEQCPNVLPQTSS